MRFDRRHVEGPDAGFLGADIDVSVFTGSVERSVTQTPGIYHYDTVPFAGYPRNPGQMQLALGGRGNWVDGYLLEEFDSGISSSFDATHVLTGSNTDRIAFRMVGFRGPADDYAIGFVASGTAGNVPNFSADPIIGTGAYGLTTTSDIGLLWVARGDNIPLLQEYMFSKTTGVEGYNINWGGISASGGLAIDLALDGFGSARVHSDVRDGIWYVGMLAIERGVNVASLSMLNLSTDRVNSAGVSISGMGNMSAAGSPFKFGGAFTSAWPAQNVYSAFYIASGTNAMSGVVGNEANLLRSFARVIRAKNGFLFSGSAEVDNSIGSFGSHPNTQFVTQRLLGLGTASLGRSRGFLTITTGTIPSWSNQHIRNSSFVLTPFSSSDHEAQVLGYFRSGSQAIETSPVPASASMYYSKYGRYKSVTVKKTASVLDLTRLPTTMDGATPVYYVPSKGTDITTVTGTLAYAPTIQNAPQRSSVLFPAMIPIDVNHQGKIVDIKVWIELMQTSGSTSTDSAGAYPLGNLAIAIRSPNVRGFHAHPIRNDSTIKKVFTSDLAEFSSAGAFGSIGRSLFGPDYIAPFYRDSFILWEGPGVFGEGSGGPWDTDTETGGFAHFVTHKYPCWQRDRSMRTVFADGAPIRNPRHHIGTSMSGNYVGSPNHSRGFTNAYGFDVPWTSETEISGAGTHVSAGSPPKGWLSGPGGTNLTDEWPTTGSNYGADCIQPLYPMLDPLYQRKRYGDVVRRPNTGSAQFDPGKWTGFRPGLRGTEVSGTWYLMVADTRVTRDYADYTPTYLRQVRLEFTLASGSYTDSSFHRYSKVRARKAGREVLVMTISGSDLLYNATGSWDAHISDTYLYQESTSDRGPDAAPEISRTIGIGFLTGSAESGDFALLYRVTGTLADLSGTNPGWLLNNPFGTPVIPLSSASLVDPDVRPIVTLHPQDILSDRGILSTAVRIDEAAQDVNPPTTRAEAFDRAIISLNEEEE